jgi:Fe-S cluster assembly protein SufD
MTQLETNKFDAKQWYVSSFDLFEENLNGSKDTPFCATRKNAISRFAELGFPSQKDEEWKYTSVAPILRQKFNHTAAPVNVSEEAIGDFTFDGLEDSLLVFVNGHFSPKLSTFEAKPVGVVIGSLKTLIIEHPDLLLKHLGQYASFEKESFTALNTAFTEDGACIYVPRDTIVEQPVHLLNLSVGQDAPFISHPRKLVVVGRGSELQFIESFHSLSDDLYFNNQVTEVVVEENAKVQHIKVQEESLKAFHVANSQIQQERHSVYSSVNIDLGSALTRNNLNIRLNAENCESHLFGFYHGQGTQHIDSHTFIDHAMPHCFSNELYKGILDGKANAVFSGKILVRQDAQKTNALQSNKTLLLTDEASISAKPQLEIFADDVKCTHGATIGQLDDEALFYLRARGIGQDVASALLRYAFARDIFENIGIESVRKKLDEKILRRLTGVREV